MFYATFFIADGMYGIPILLVEEFLRPSGVTPVPLTDRRIEGLVNLRGKTATVLNLRRCLEKEDVAPGIRSKMLLLETQEGLTEEALTYDLESHEEPIVLRVDGVHRIMNFEPKEMHPPPAHIAYPFVEGVFRLEKEYITILSIPKLINRLKSDGGIE